MSRTGVEDGGVVTQPSESVAAEPAAQKDISEKSAVVGAATPANPSRESVNANVKPSGKKKEKASAKKKGQKAEDRDCVVM
jgi:hypothetical protein